VSAAPVDLMPSLVAYPLRQADGPEHYHGNQLVYLHWENHLMYAAPFCVPLPPTLPFGALVRDVLAELYGEHPEFESIDWQRTRWFKSGKRFVPDMGKSLAHHGLGHKCLIRFVTPALEGIRRELEPGVHAY
jgi:phenol hydroxylase P4 protein